MRYVSLVLSLTGILWAALAARFATAADIDPRDAIAAIDKGVAFLERTQRPDGSWPAYSAAYDTTSLCTLALLNAGVDVESEVIQKALKFLRNPARDSRNTYVVSLDTMVFCLAEPDSDRLQIKDNVKWLQDNQERGGEERRGSWGYPGNGGDNSNTQFAMLALYEADRSGVEVSDATWRAALAYWQNSQNDDGSWGYQPNAGGTGSMTSAGVCSIVIAQGRLNDGDAGVNGNRVRCCGEQLENEHVENGLRWLASNYQIDINPGDSQHVYYYLYGLERVGRLTARRFIGDNDWYRDGTAKLIAEQDDLRGLWIGVGHGEENEHVGTSFALLFLAKGRRPVLWAKLRHGPEGTEDWNRHRNDVAHMTTYVETQWKRDLAWQTIDVATAPVADLLQTPVLYFNGEEPPDFSDQEIKRLREYIQRGGFLFVEPCCQDRKLKFDRGFRAMIARLFPEKDEQGRLIYELRELGPEHSIWHIEEPVPPEHVRPLWGVNFGCRTSVVYVAPEPPDDPRPSLSCLWELSDPAHGVKYSDAVREQIDAARAIGINVLAYATNREVKYKYENFQQAGDLAAQDPNDRGLLYIPKLKHTGGWNVAPGALLALQETMIREQGLRIATDQRELEILDPGLFNYHLVFLHGRNDFAFSEGEREQLRTYLERGGMLLADAVCSSDQFTRAFRREMLSIFADRPLERIPPDHPLFTSAYGGFELATVTRREPQRAADGSLQNINRQAEPHLEGIVVNDRYAVFFSPYDLSCALENHATLECPGYTREDAARMGLNVIVYSLQE